MAAYEYDEAGVMAAYFLITFLALVLTPFTLTALFKRSEKELASTCQCGQCAEHVNDLRKQNKGSIFSPKIARRTWLLIAGWSLFAFVSYRVSFLKVENKIYDPFEILGISSSTEEKEIKSHFKKLSKLYHPDKVKATANETLEMIQERFVQITKAYKSLTDEKIRENWIKYNNPDGPQSTTMGIALPKWIIEGKNNIWVLGAYGLVFGGALPALVGRWWFGNRQKTKDGINARSASAFFKSVKEDSTMEEIVGALVKAYKWELGTAKSKAGAEVDALEKEIEAKLGSKWIDVKLATRDYAGEIDELQKQALVLLYAHLLRLKVVDSGLRKLQKQVILQTPLLLNALLNTVNSRNWLNSTLAVMRLHAFFTQALPPVNNEQLALTQLPHIKEAELEDMGDVRTMGDLLETLEKSHDSRSGDIKRAMQAWGRVNVVDVDFRVIGEKIVTPSAIVFLLVKLRLAPPGVTEPKEPELSVDEAKRLVVLNGELDEAFLASKHDAEELPEGAKVISAAHAPHWPAPRKPNWWIVLADDKSNRVVVPPMKITDIPYSQSGADRDYRSYKIQFQCPPNVGVFTWRVYLVSDTFVGEDVVRDITLTVQNPPTDEDQPSEDEISDPDEDTIAGQMAAMRGGTVKKRKDEDSDDDESSTDDDKSNGSDSDSDSD